jgi:hypothetical protein
MKNISLGRKYDRRDLREGIPLERFLERRNIQLSEWLSANKIKSVIEAEEKVKTLGICITSQSLKDIINYFEKPVSLDGPLTQPVEERNLELVPEKPKKKKSTTETSNETV